MISTDDTFEGNERKDSKDVAILILTELHCEQKKMKILFYFLIIMLIKIARKKYIKKKKIWIKLIEIRYFPFLCII